MSAIPETGPVSRLPRRPPRPSFRGALGGEILKLRRQGWIWAMLGVAVLLFALFSLTVLQVTHMRQTLQASPALFLYNLDDIYLNVFDSGAGILLLIVSARLVGMEYTGGTIRILLGRGAGRVRLLLAKLVALALLGLAILAGYLVLVVGSVSLSVLSWGDRLSSLTAAPTHVWTDLRVSLLIALTSVGIAILIGATAAVVGRSLTFGLAAALVLFPADNVLAEIFSLLFQLTHLHFWLDLTTYLLGPALNALPTVMERDRVPHVAFAPPAIPVSAAHDWLVVGGWAVALLLAALLLARLRDVLE